MLAAVKFPLACRALLIAAWFVAAAAHAQTNDSFAGRLTLTGASPTAVSNNGRATREPGEPNHAAGGGASSLWWTWTAPATGLVNFSAYAGGALPAGFYPSTAMAPRTLAVYTGDSLPALSEVASANAPDPSTSGYFYYSPSSSVPAGPSFNFQVTAGTVYQIAVSVPSSQGSLADDGTMVLAINQPPAIYSAAGARATVGGSFTYTVLASNNPTAYQATSLPTGLSLNPATGEISGTPSATGVYAVGLAATNPGGTATATLTLEVTAPAAAAAPTAPVITSAATAGGIVGASFSYSIYNNGGASAYDAANLPPGLSIDKTSGYITGTPTTAGDYSVTVSATNTAGTGSAGVLFRFAAAPHAPVITSNLAASGTVGSSFYYSVSTADSSGVSAPTGYTASNLPPGLGFDTSAGTLRGTPTTAGVYPVTLTATNAGGTGSAVVTVTILAPSPAAAAQAAPPVPNSAATATATAGTAFIYQLGASNAPTNFAATDLPPGLSLNTQDGYVTGTPLTAGVYRVPVGATNAYGTGSATLTITVASAASATVPSDLPPAVTSPAEVVTSVGGYVSYQVTATYGSYGYYYGYPSSVVVGASSLPPGLSFNPSYGQITGSPTKAGTYQSRISVTAPSSSYSYPQQYVTGTAVVTFVVNAAAPASAPTVPVFSSAASVAGVQGSAFGGYTASASGSPTGYTATGLPPGLSFDASSSYVSGTPTAAGTYQATFTAANSAGTGMATVTFAIAAAAPPTPAPIISSSAVATGTVGKSFSYSISGNNSPTSYAAGSLPPGLSVNTATGSISGTPTASGVFAVPISAVNASGTANATLTLTVAAGPAAPTISSDATARGTVGSSFSYYLSASNSPTGYTAGTLPDGLTFNASSGQISGTPTAAGVFTVPVTATNAAATASATLTITVAAGPAAPMFSGNAAVGGVAGSVFSHYLSASNFPSSYAASGLPPGLSIDPVSGAISGTPTQAGAYPAAVSATNAGGTASATLTITVAASSPPLQAPVITSVAAATALVGTAFTYTITATNSPTAYDLGSSTPPGLSFDPKTGTLAGTPTAVGKFSVPVYAVNSAGNARAVVTLVFTAQPTARPVVTAPAGLNVYVGQPFSLPLSADNAPTSFAASNLPPGLSLNPSTGLLSGTPTSSYPTTYAATVSATNAVGTGSAVLTFRVGSGSAAYITSPMAAGGVRGTAFSYTITAAGGAYSYSAVNLPPGLSYNSGTGVISGTPTATGTYTASVSASTSLGTAGARIVFLITAASGGAPVPTTSAGAVAYTDDAFSYPLAATNSPTSFTVGSLPSGLTYDSVKKAIVGTPAYTGTASVNVTATNAAGSVTGTLNLILRSGAGPRVTSPAAAGGLTGMAFSYAPTTGTTAYAYSYNVSNLPPGLTLNTFSGQISGTPTAAGTFTVPLSVYTYSGQASATLKFSIDDQPSAPPVFAGAAEAVGTVGAPLRSSLAATNQPTAFTASGLPAGLALDGASGAISGVPTAAGVFSLPVSATNAVGTSTATLTLAIAAAPAASPDLSANSLAVALTAGNAGVLYQAQATNGPVTFTASGLPPGLSIDPVSGAVSGAVGTPGNFAATLSATNAKGTSSAVVTFNVSAGRAPVFSSVDANFVGTAGVSFSDWISASASPAASYTASGLPPGLYLDSGSGQIFGTPSAAGTFTATLAATNALGSDAATVVFVISAPGVPTFSGDSAQQTANLGGSFSRSYYASKAVSYTVSGLPPGLGYSFSSGSSVTIRGTPTAAGAYPVTITANNAAGPASEVVTLLVAAPSVSPPASITSAAGAGGSVNAPFSYRISANNSPTAYTATGLPDGLQLNPATGYITGTPAAVGTSSVAVTAANAGGTASAVVTVQIDTSPAPAPAAPVITSAAAISFGSNSSNLFYSQSSGFGYTITAGGSPTIFGASNLPPGLSLNPATGVISGVPQAAGTFLVPISAANAAGTGNAILTIQIPLAAPVPQGALTVSGAVNSSFSYTVGLVNSSQSYESYYYLFYSTAVPDAPAFAAVGLPPGLSLNRTTGQITGTPAQAGSFPVTLSASNRAGSGTAVVTFVIAATAPPSATAPPTLSANAAAPGFVGAPFSFYLSGSGTSYAASGLPPGLTLNPSSGQITGTPTAAGTYAVAVSRTNAVGTASAVLTIAVLPSPDAPIISSNAGASATVGSSFNYSIYAGTSTFVPSPISYGAGSLPPGLAFNAANGSLSGTPTQAGVFTVPISAASAGVVTQGTLTLTVRPAPATPPAVATPLLAGPAGGSGFLGNPFAYPVRLAGFTPDGTLPAGLSFDPATGTLAGTPTDAGVFNLPLSATNAGGTGHATLTLRFIRPDLSLPRFTAQPVGGSAAQGSGVSLSAAATGAPAPAYQWTHDGVVVAGATGPTLSFSAVQPADAGVYTLTATNSSGTAQSNAVTLRVVQTFAGWQNTYFTAQEIAAGYAAPGYDFDGDGWPNLLAYALGRNPRTGVGGLAPTGSRTPGGALTIQYNRDGGKTDLEYTVEASSDLRGWTAVARSSVGGATVNLGGAGAITETAVGGGIVTVTVQDGAASAPNGARFLRLRVSQP